MIVAKFRLLIHKLFSYFWPVRISPLPAPILQLCERLSGVTYENITKILHLQAHGNKTRAQQQENALQYDVDHWMGGGTCFSLTWYLYRELKSLGFQPRLLMGHKRTVRNVHCALILPHNGVEWFLDPGYLIFDPLPVPVPPPLGNGWNLHPLRPNWVRLEHHNGTLALQTGLGDEKPRLRFEFPLQGVDEAEFHQHWVDSFSAEMMHYPVLNRLDREQGVQYYYQKGNLLIRSAAGSEMRTIAKADRQSEVQRIFRLAPELVQQALDWL